MNIHREQSESVPKILTIASHEPMLYIEEGFLTSAESRATTVTLTSGSTLVYCWNVAARGQTDRSITFNLADRATLMFYGIVLGRDHDHAQLHLAVNHNTGASKSVTTLRSVAYGSAQFVADANIAIRHDAQHSDAYLESRAILLGEQARASVRPSLEIEARDVQAKHAATTGPIDPEQILYLQSRGLPHDGARHTILRGFVYDLLHKLPREEEQALLIARWDEALARYA